MVTFLGYEITRIYPEGNPRPSEAIQTLATLFEGKVAAIEMIQ